MEWVKLGDVCIPKQFKTIPKKDMTEKGYPLFGANGKIGYYSKYSHVEETICITCRGTCGQVNMSLPYSYINGNAMTLNNLDEKTFDKWFLFYYLKYRGFDDVITGSVQPQIIASNLSKILLPVINLSQQKKIVKNIRLIESLISTRKAQIAALDELVQSVFYEMFGDVYEKRFKVVKIKDIYTSTQYGSSSKASDQVKQYPILRMGNITYDGKLDLSDLKYIDLAEDERDKYLVQKNDLLFNRTNSVELVGKTALYDLEEPMAYAGYLIRLRIDEKYILPQFLNVQMNSPYLKKVLRHMAKGIIGQANINAKEMLEIDIILPPLELQEQFTAKVEAIEAEKAKLQTSLKEMETLFDALMQEAFSGNLG